MGAEFLYALATYSLLIGFVSQTDVDLMSFAEVVSVSSVRYS